jgi:hypothetical protein
MKVGELVFFQNCLLCGSNITNSWRIVSQIVPLKELYGTQIWLDDNEQHTN